MSHIPNTTSAHSASIFLRIVFRTIFALLFFMHTLPAIGQVHRISLDSLSVMDDQWTGVHIFTSQPSHPVKLPPGDNQNRRFLREFYSWKMTDKPDIIVMVESQKAGDLLYIDRNLNDDLTDDGAPIFFPFKQDTITFDIVAPKDARQQTKIIFARTLNYKRIYREMADSIRSQEIDRFGNLNPKYAAFTGAGHGEPDFKGTAGSFYFGDRVSVRKGHVMLRGQEYAIGLFDVSNNGLFNDDDDLVLTGTGTSNKILRNPYDAPDKAFTLSDVFTIGDRRYRIRNVDKYGTWMEIEETEDAATSLFKEHYDSQTISGARSVKFSPALWNNRFVTMEGDTIVLSSLKGKFLLLNFWGEWCEPCREELPALVEARRSYPDSLIRFLSFINIGSKEKAQTMIRESGITWTQIPITDEIVKKFNVHGYPSNILIFPNGEECVSLNQVNALFFKTYVR